MKHLKRFNVGNTVMKKIKTYNQFKESLVIDLSFQGIEDLLESLTIWYDALLSAIGAEEVNIFDTLKLPTDDFSDKLDLDILGDNVEFIKDDILNVFRNQKEDLNELDALNSNLMGEETQEDDILFLI
jgi:hypothetical protein